MPSWLLNWLLPIIIQAVTPLVTEGIKRLVEMISQKMPGTAVVALAGVIGEVVNQVQGQVTGMSLPPGASGLLAVAMNELKNDFQNAAGNHPTDL